MKTVIVAALAVALGTSPYRAAAQGADAEMAVAEALFRVEELYPQNLHQAPRFSDGARGIMMGSAPGQPVVTANPVFHGPAEETLFRTICNADAVVVGRVVSQQPLLSSRQQMIFTASQVSVVALLKPGLDLQPGAEVRIWERGGEVVDAGERLRVLNMTDPPVGVGADYLLVLHERRGANGVRAVFTERPAPRIDGDRIAADQPRWQVFAAGATIPDVQTEMQRVMGLAACVK